MYGGYKYQPTGSFKTRAPKVDPKGCFYSFLIFVIIVGVIVGLSIFFDLE